MNEIWGSGIGLAVAGLRQKFREMKRLEVDMLAMDKPGFTKTIQASALNYAADGNAIGISAGKIQEVTDVSAENQLRCFAAQAKSSAALAKYLGEYEKAFGTMGGANAFITSGNKIAVALHTTISHGGESVANKKAVLEAIQHHTLQLKTVADKLQSIRNVASGELSGQIPEINQLLTDIAELNAKMQGSETGSENLAYLRQRRAKLDELSQYMEIQVSNHDSEFLVYTPKGRVLVQEALAAKFIYTPPREIDAAQAFGPGTITLQSIAVDPTLMEAPSTGTHNAGDPGYYDRRHESFVFDVSQDFTDTQGGAISGLISFLQSDSVDFGRQLDAYAAGLCDSFNNLHDDLITLTPGFVRDGANTGLASHITVNGAMLARPELFVLHAPDADGDLSVARSLSDLFTRTKTDFPTPGRVTNQTLEAFSTGLVAQVASSARFYTDENEALADAYKQQEALFSQEYGMDEQEIAIRSMQISKSQDLYFSFINNYWRMMSRIADMGS